MAEPLDLICVGEALVDFLPQSAGRRVRDVDQWVRCSGGSPANVAVGAARLGAQSAMLGVVGDDEFGIFLSEALRKEGVDVSRLRMTNEGKTGLVFISLDATGERHFSFFRSHSAEFFLDERDVDVDFLVAARAIHFGSNSLLFPGARRAALKMLRVAKANGRIVSCDPNLRLHLWSEPSELRAFLLEALPLCSVVKLSDDEVEFVTGHSDPQAALWALQKMGIPLPIVTLGAKGAAFCWQEKVIGVASPEVQVVDTTGAGDGFVAGLLVGLTRLFPGQGALRQAGVGELRELIAFGCQVGARVVTQLGAVSGLPMLEAMKGALPSLLR